MVRQQEHFSGKNQIRHRLLETVSTRLDLSRLVISKGIITSISWSKHARGGPIFQMMEQKSGAARVIIKSLSKLQKIWNRKAKRLHTNGAKKDDTKELRDYLDISAMEATKTAPTTSRSKAFAERRFRQLLSAIRTTVTAGPHMPKSFWSFATLDAADKGNYLSTSKQGKPHMILNRNIGTQFAGARFTNPSTFLPCGR